jgi:hypothetical protein
MKPLNEIELGTPYWYIDSANEVSNSICMGDMRDGIMYLCGNLYLDRAEAKAKE